MKRFRLKKDMRIPKVIIYTLLLFCTIILTNYSKSYPKYIASEENALSVNSNLYSLYKGESLISGIITNDSTNRLIHYQFDFSRNNVVTDNSIDKYIVTVPSGCTRLDLFPASDSVLDGNTISYNSIDIGTRNQVDVYCEVSVNEVTNMLNSYTFLIEEQVLDEDKFLYKRYVTNPNLSLDEYYKLINYQEEPTPTVEFLRLIIPDAVQDKDTVFNNWIRAFAHKYANDIAPLEEKTITDYVAGFCPSTLATIPVPAGMNYEYNTTTKEHIYTISNNFVGYARTYIGQLPEVNSRLLYFTTSVASEQQEALTYYLQKYYNSDKSAEILAYVASKGGISTLINNSIPGFTVIQNNNLEIIIKLKSNILDYLYTPDPNSPVRINFDTNQTMANAFFAEGYLTSKFNGIISAEAEKNINTYPNNKPYYQSIIKNEVLNGESANISFTDYHVTYDPTNNYYLLFKIYSDVELDSTHKYNTIEVSPLRVPNSNIKIVTSNDPNNETKLTITLTYNDNNETLDAEEKEDILEVIDYLNTYFNQNITISDADFVSDGANNYNITYNVTKVIARPPII